jgi:hypothetical protein
MHSCHSLFLFSVILLMGGTSAQADGLCVLRGTVSQAASGQTFSNPQCLGAQLVTQLNKLGAQVRWLYEFYIS